MNGARLVTMALFTSGALALGCYDADEGRASANVEVTEAMRSYVVDPAYRRRVLEESLVTRDNAYARLRLERYDEERWGALPEHDPKTAPITLAGHGEEPRPPAEGDDAWAALDAEATGWTHAELRALGERAFFRYPVQTSHGMPRALATPDRAGMWEDGGRIGGVWAALPHGVVAAALTCATCHASKVHGRLIAGRNNADLDAARIYGDGEHGGAAWGPGRVDVTEDGIDNPVAIADLRAVRHQEHLHRAATLRNSPAALAVRIETLLVTSSHEAVRPPRKIAAALAVYLLSLAPTSPLPTGEGAIVFARECARCHRGEGASGPAVPLAAVGTDDLVGRSPDRGTGFYRVPSLRAVGDRRALFASGVVANVEEVLSPQRSAPGHRYGQDLSEKDRAALLEYLHAL